jgi:phosphopantetheine adenylyltransferase/dephospho-CoA kinase
VRVEARDSLSREDAERRIDSQLSNQERIRQATFVFSSLWEPEFTRKQVSKAWAQVKSLVDPL